MSRDSDNRHRGYASSDVSLCSTISVRHSSLSFHLIIDKLRTNCVKLSINHATNNLCRRHNRHGLGLSPLWRQLTEAGFIPPSNNYRSILSTRQMQNKTAVCTSYISFDKAGSDIRRAGFQGTEKVEMGMAGLRNKRERKGNGRRRRDKEIEGMDGQRRGVVRWKLGGMNQD